MSTFLVASCHHYHVLDRVPALFVAQKCCSFPTGHGMLFATYKDNYIAISFEQDQVCILKYSLHLVLGVVFGEGIVFRNYDHALCVLPKCVFLFHMIVSLLLMFAPSEDI